MSTGYTILVSGLDPSTSEQKLNDFFSFCGKLLSVTKTEKTAVLVFEKESASKTALMLSGGTLDGAHLEVTSPAVVAPVATLPATVSGSTPIGVKLDAEGHVIEQEDKPKSAIVAEYLAHGYVFGDHIIQRAIDIDHKQGISSKFLTYIGSLDKSVGAKVVGPEQTVSGALQTHLNTAITKTQEVDQHRGISKKTGDYYSKVIGTPIGKKVFDFYTTTSKQVIDVHEEAKRIAAEKKAASIPTTPVTTATPPSETPIAAAPTTTASSITPSSIGNAILGKVETLTGTGAAAGEKPLSTQLSEAVQSVKDTVVGTTSTTPAPVVPTAPVV